MRVAGSSLLLSLASAALLVAPEAQACEVDFVQPWSKVLEPGVTVSCARPASQPHGNCQVITVAAEGKPAWSFDADGLAASEVWSFNGGDLIVAGDPELAFVRRGTEGQSVARTGRISPRVDQLLTATEADRLPRSRCGRAQTLSLTRLDPHFLKLVLQQAEDPTVNLDRARAMADPELFLRPTKFLPSIEMKIAVSTGAVTRITPVPGHSADPQRPPGVPGAKAEPAIPSFKPKESGSFCSIGAGAPLCLLAALVLRRRRSLQGCGATFKSAAPGSPAAADTSPRRSPALPSRPPPSVPLPRW
jgi:hypothetical protein